MHVLLEVLPSIGIVNSCLARGLTLYRNYDLMSHDTVLLGTGIVSSCLTSRFLIRYRNCDRISHGTV